MTLLQRIERFKRAAQSQDDDTPVEDIINRMTPYELLSEISEALDMANITLNEDF